MSRMRSGDMPFAPIWDDIRTFDGGPWRGAVDLISGGFPCQDVSRANSKGKGLAGAKSGLWFEMLRVVREVGLRFVFVENTPGLADGGGLLAVLEGLRSAGYVGCAVSFEAAEVGAPFEGRRIFLLAEADSFYVEGSGSGRIEVPTTQIEPEPPRRARSAVSLRRAGVQALPSSDVQPGGISAPDQQVGQTEEQFIGSGLRTAEPGRFGFRRSGDASGRPETFWSHGIVVRERLIKPGLCVLAHGIPRRVGQIRCYGNAVVPWQASLAWKILTYYLSTYL